MARSFLTRAPQNLAAVVIPIHPPREREGAAVLTGQATSKRALEGLWGTDWIQVAVTEALALLRGSRSQSQLPYVALEQ